MQTVRVALSGATGRMGRTVGRLAAREEALEVIGGLDRDGVALGLEGIPRIVSVEAGEELLRGAHVIIDFSAPVFLRTVLERLEGTQAALVVGTTGLGPEEREHLEEESDRRPVLTAANFSVGVNLLLALAERTAAALGTDFDIEIVEAHHRRKEDAPSGTALALGEAVARGRGVELERVRQDGRTGRPGARAPQEIGFHSLRGGEVIGDHHVHFIGDVERIELTHRAGDRALFAAGALRAARWIAGRKPGRYTMADVLGI